jgi:hypothetical protein
MQLQQQIAAHLSITEKNLCGHICCVGGGRMGVGSFACYSPGGLKCLYSRGEYVKYQDVMHGDSHISLAKASHFKGIGECNLCVPERERN